MEISFLLLLLKFTGDVDLKVKVDVDEEDSDSIDPLSPEFGNIRLSEKIVKVKFYHVLADLSGSGKGNDFFSEKLTLRYIFIT